MRRMLVNAQNPEQIRMAVIDGTTLESYQLEVSERGLTRGNIYRGVIANIQPSLNAAFVDYGTDKDGFLPIQDVVPDAMYHVPKKGARPRIEEVLERGKPIVVQVGRDPEAQKGAALTTNLSLAGRYLVLTPFDRQIGISRKVEDEEHRRELKDIAAKLDLPEGCGVIVRTNARDQNLTMLRREVKGLLRLWKQIEGSARQGKGSKVLYQEGDLVIKALRDLLDSAVGEVLVDNEAAYEHADQYMRTFMPRSKTRLIYYQERMPLFAKYGLEEKLEAIYQRKVPLTSGGSVVIDPTEALTAIDVNSGRATKGASQEETAYQTNLEAANEVARQLRLRDIGGLVVVDFIDMRSRKYQRNVEKAVKDALKVDQARTSVGRISPNGLLEINRQKIRQALEIRTHRGCPTCDGTGRIASQEFTGVSLLRRIEARAADGRLAHARIELHPELADAFQNSRRREILALEKEFEMTVEIIASSSLHRAEEHIEWVPRGTARRRTGERKGAAKPRSATGREEKPKKSPPQPKEAEVVKARKTPPPEKETKPTRRRRRRPRRSEANGKETAMKTPASASTPEPAAAMKSEPSVASQSDREASAGSNGSTDDAATGNGPRRLGRRGRRGRTGAEKVATEDPTATES